MKYIKMQMNWKNPVRQSQSICRRLKWADNLMSLIIVDTGVHSNKVLKLSKVNFNSRECLCIFLRNMHKRGRREMHAGFWCWNMKKENWRPKHRRKDDIKCILKQYVVWIKFIWLKLGTSYRLLWTCTTIFNPGNFWTNCQSVSFSRRTQHTAVPDLVNYYTIFKTRTLLNFILYLTCILS
jgi:hypothetical protein